MHMNRHPKRAKRRPEIIPVWTFAQIHAALPYLNSIMKSLREHRLDVQTYELKAQRLGKQPGRPDRTILIDRQEAIQESHQAKSRFEEALEELQDMGIYCLDPISGVALVPFAHDKQLAFFVYELFDPDKLRFWRYYNDPVETRRPIIEGQKTPPGPPPMPGNFKMEIWYGDMK
jgi:hypothetical protein